MTQSFADIGLTADAEARLADYLRQVRAALARSPDVNPDEVEGDIREHVENEVRDRPRPVGRGTLEGVLTRLGPPTQWLPIGHAEPPSHSPVQYLKARWHAAKQAVWRGPEDWRLPYLAAGVFALSVVFPPFLLLGYVLGVVLFAGWWAVVGLVAGRFPCVVRSVFVPFAVRRDREPDGLHSPGLHRRSGTSLPGRG